MYSLKVHILQSSDLVSYSIAYIVKGAINNCDKIYSNIVKNSFLIVLN